MNATQENTMPRRHITLAFATLLASAPLVAAGAAAAESTGQPDRATTTAPATTPRGNDDGRKVAPVPNVESSAPATPMPMSLPDRASADEVKGEYGIGIAGLIIGTMLVVALVVGTLYVISRRSWSASH
jgi:hypothetical protein